MVEKRHSLRRDNALINYYSQFRLQQSSPYYDPLREYYFLVQLFLRIDFLQIKAVLFIGTLQLTQ
jgi:hypothetical protein